MSFQRLQHQYLKVHATAAQRDNPIAASSGSTARLSSCMRTFCLSGSWTLVVNRTAKEMTAVLQQGATTLLHNIRLK